MKLSVCLIAYNHEAFIAKAIEGVLMQECAFDYELIIGDDHSQDATQKIIREYHRKHPQIIRPVLQETNQGMGMHARLLLSECRGEYIALVEGDDYWTDPHKLQKQVDFLDGRPDYSLCSHRFKVYLDNEDRYEEDYYPELFDKNPGGILIDTDIFFKYWLTKTLTVIFRRRFLDLPLMAGYTHFRDVHIFFHLLQHGPGFCMNFFGGVYTRHDQGAWGEKDSLTRTTHSYEVYKELQQNNPGYPTLDKSTLGVLSRLIDEKIAANGWPLLSADIYMDILELARKSRSNKEPVKKLMKLFKNPA